MIFRTCFSENRRKWSNASRLMVPITLSVNAFILGCMGEQIRLHRRAVSAAHDQSSLLSTSLWSCRTDVNTLNSVPAIINWGKLKCVVIYQCLLIRKIFRKQFNSLFHKLSTWIFSQVPLNSSTGFQEFFQLPVGCIFPCFLNVWTIRLTVVGFRLIPNFLSSSAILWHPQRPVTEPVEVSCFISSIKSLISLETGFLPGVLCLYVQ